MFGLVAGPGQRLSTRAKNGLLGIVYVAIAVGVVVLLVMNFQGVFRGRIPVTAEMISIGDGMQAGAEVKFRNLTLGEVIKVRVSGDLIGADLLIDKDKIGNIPANVTARVVPTTLFGNAQVMLVDPEQRQGELQRDDQIAANRDGDTFELQDALNEFRRLVAAAPPAQLDATLSALGESLDGRGAKLGATAQRLDAYLAALEPHLPAIKADVKALGNALQTFSVAVPDLVAAMKNARTTIKTFNDKQPEFAALLAGTPVFARDVNKWLEANDQNIITVIKNTRPVIGVMAKHKRDVTDSIKFVNLTLDKWGNVLANREGPGLPLGGFYGGMDLKGYEAPKDCPRYPGLAGPNCSGGQARPAIGRYVGNVGYAGSDAEAQAIMEALAISAQDPEFDAARVYFAPLLRGRTVVAG